MKTVANLIWKELCGRKANFLLTLLAVTAAVALCVMLSLTEAANQRETKRLMRDLGFNLRVIPHNTDMNQFYLTGFSDQAMPEDSLDKLAKVKNMSYNHLVAVLHGKTDLAGQDVLLLGISEEKAPPGRKKPPMVKAVEQGQVHVGHQVAERLALKKGDELELNGHRFNIARRMPEMGSIDDLRVVGALSDMQRVLGLEGQINEIKAIDCLCLTPADNPKDILQAEIESTLPSTRVVMLSNIAEARARQRQTSDRNAAFVVTAVLLIAAAWVGLMAVANVRQRASEIGLLKALGYGSTSVASLILGRALLIGLIAALLGTALGTWGAITFGPRIFHFTARAIQPQMSLFGYALLATPLFVAAVSLVPAAMAVAQDPAQVLRRQ
ncbi:MAG: ABC transporter permease [Bythopirellula sp.]